MVEVDVDVEYDVTDWRVPVLDELDMTEYAGGRSELPAVAAGVADAAAGPACREAPAPSRTPARRSASIKSAFSMQPRVDTPSSPIIRFNSLTLSCSRSAASPERAAPPDCPSGLLEAADD